MDRKKKLRLARIAANLCSRCGLNPPVHQKLQCQKCLDYTKSVRNSKAMSDYKKQARLERLSAGLCVSCGIEPHRKSKTTCEKCSTTLNNYSRKHKDKCKANKKCTRCRNPSYGEYVICQGCRTKEHDAKIKVYLESGLCKTCGRRPIKNDESTLCQICTDRLRKNHKARSKRLWLVILNHYGAYCNCCGEDIVEFLTIDHVNNDGAEHKRQVGRDSYRVRRWIISNQFPETIQILCYNCNCAKGKLGYCPHHKAP